jgi:predicted dehydrogenase
MSTSRKLKIGVAGGGLIAQVEHIPNLLALPDLFELRAVCDPSPSTRARLGARYGVATHAELRALLDLGLDAILIATPDPWHGAMVADAMRAGLHVFCEKPLCYGPDEIAELIAARDAAGRVLQVGYMKRLDPSYQRARALVAGRAEQLVYVSVEVSDPDAWPFVDHHPYTGADDVPVELRKATSERRAAQVTAALGFTPGPLVLNGFTGAYSSAIIHDVNAVHGLLDVAGVQRLEPRAATFFAGGAGGQATVALDGGRALWNMAHFQVPKLADYAERIAFYFEDSIVELVFASPYLNHTPTRLVVRRSDGLALSGEEIRVSYRAAFVEELRAFHAAVSGHAAPVNPAEDALRDARLLVALARLAAA